ncbi:hypothetical protein AURDEDRAFT_165764 [Auricularia subglabra TFB-10046 SS5]|nr:hypothetical protein AURDEDRAFT_165764 [Auricularia subglabra TFB-10046 SS5]
MLPVAAISHVCGIHFSFGENRVQRVKLLHTRPGRTIAIPRAFFGTSTVYLARVWVMTPTGVMQKFLVYFTAVVGPLRDDRPRVDRAFVFAISSNERLYVCFRDIPFARDVVAGVEELSLVIAHEAVGIIWPIFRLPAPQLRILQTVVTDTTPTTQPIPALFGAQDRSALERVLLYDVPIAADMPPINHTVKVVQAMYMRAPTHLPRVAAMIPRTQTLNLFAADAAYYPPPHLVEFSSLSALSVYNEDWLLAEHTINISQLVLYVCA